MSGDPKVSRGEVRAMSKMMNLRLSEERVDQLTTTLSAYLANFERLRNIDIGDREPPTITYEKEASS